MKERIDIGYNFTILKNETDEDHQEWINACENTKYNVTYKIIDITKSDWLEQVLDTNSDCYLTRPPAVIGYFKQLYDERLYILNGVLNKKIYPSYLENLIYENKRLLSYWVEANEIPHPKTWIFYHKNEALRFIDECCLPIAAKTAIGASGSGVKIFRNKSSLKKYIEQVFSEKGFMRKWGPNLRRGEVWKRFVNRIENIPDSYKYFRNKYISMSKSLHQWHVILQEYIDCDFEWRAVRIGGSYFAHKKIRKKGELFSGTSEVSWDPPPERLLNFVKYVCDKGKFLSQAIDIFENKGGQYLVNELQCFFGSKNPHQMILNGKPGRYIYEKGQWIFEQGNFNTNNSFDLRLKHVISLLRDKKL
jgi:hypothetical protein